MPAGARLDSEARELAQVVRPIAVILYPGRPFCRFVGPSQ
jgi:hypothetical protein